MAALTTAVQDLANQDLHGLSAATLAEDVLQLGRLLDRLEGQWLKELADWTPVGLPGPRRECRSARPPAGSASGCA